MEERLRDSCRTENLDSVPPSENSNPYVRKALGSPEELQEGTAVREGGWEVG